MAQEQSTIVETKLFISRAKENKKLKDAVADCGIAFLGAIALLYAPHKCSLALVKKEGDEWRFYEGSSFKENGKEIFKEKLINIDSVFEARIFNEIAELRWLNIENGEGATVVLCEDETKKFFNDEPKADDKIYAKIEPSQTYLLWGESIDDTDNKGWTKFAEARIGSFFVPIGGIKANKKHRAQFTAIEYLGEYEDGNVAVAEERLIGIQAV